MRLAMYEPSTVLGEINGVSRYRKPFEEFVQYFPVQEDLTHSNIPFEEWLDSTIKTGQQAVMLSRKTPGLIPAVSQPGMAMAFALEGVPFVWFIRNNVGFSKAAPIPPRFREAWLRAFAGAVVIVVEGHHYLKTVHDFLDELPEGSPRPHVLEIAIPLPEELYREAHAKPTWSHKLLSEVASVVALPVPWKTADGEIVSWMERTQTVLGWLWLTGHATSGMVYEMHRWARIGVHLSVGEAFSLVTMEHLVFHPTFALDRDGFHEDFGGLVVPVKDPEDLLVKCKDSLSSITGWVAQVQVQRNYLLEMHTPRKFQQSMQAVLETAVVRHAQMCS